MDEMKETFLKGAESKQINLDKANKVFELCYKFAEYGFNKSHSAAYSVVSYHTAYLKTHYPAEYMTALLSSVQGVSEKISLYIQESIDMNLQILPPNVNESTIDFVTKDNKIRFGLGSVKNVGDGAIENIVQKRRDGNYKSLMDFCTKVDLKVVNKRVIESLIKVGAFDEVGKRDYMLSIYEQVIDRAQVIEKEQRNGQIGLFGNTDTGTGVALLDDQNLTPQYIGIQPGSLLQMEKELLGLYISAHPLDNFQHLYKDNIKLTNQINETHDGRSVSVLGILVNVRVITTKNNREMVIATLEDKSGTMNLLLFQGPFYKSVKPLLVEDNIVSIKGKVKANNSDVSIAIENANLIEQNNQPIQVHIDINNFTNETSLEMIKTICQKYKGATPVYLHLDDKQILVNQKYWVSDSDLYFNELQTHLGQGRIWKT